MKNLIKYGASDRFIAEATMYPELFLGRIITQHKDFYEIITEKGTGLAEISGKLRHDAYSSTDYPAVGDFVMVDREEFSGGNAIIHKVLNRKSLLTRSAVGGEIQSQLVAANIDIIFICMALDYDYNLSRLERYLSIAWDSRATPVIILTKSDLCTRLDEVTAEVGGISLGAEIYTTSSTEPLSWEPVAALIKPGITASFIGSSGVGKSTLINHLSGSEIQVTSHVQSGGKGRHTTTRRELLVFPSGGIVIDTPGMRELGIDNADLSKSFADIDELMASCRFSDCSHSSEPGCAVLAAIESGELCTRRLENYRKLQKEAGYEGLSSRQIEEKKLDMMFSEFGGMKNAKKYLKTLKK